MTSAKEREGADNIDEQTLCFSIFLVTGFAWHA